MIELYIKVKEMREVQRAYFSEKKMNVRADLLVRSKALEKEVDAILSRTEIVDGKITETKQGELW